MNIKTYTIDNHNVYQVFDVLDDLAFNNIQQQKSNLWLCPGEHNINPVIRCFDIPNYTELDNWEFNIGSAFVTLLKTINKIISEIENTDIELVQVGAQKNNQRHGFPWHKHRLPTIKYKNNELYVGIFYTHNNWDQEYTNKFDGSLRVSIDEQHSGFKLPCISNSLVIHDSYFGHCLDNLLPGCPIERECFFSNWAKKCIKN
jgi:hypothetical protein